MSNFLAIATVTATLSRVLSGPVGADVSGATVTTVRPDGTGSGTPPTGVNIFLYQVSPSAAARNEDLPTRGADGHPMRRPRVGLDLHYLFTFYGRDAQLEPQRVLGSVVKTLHARPVLSRAQIRNAVSGFPFLARSNLADDVELVKFTQLPLSLEELSKLWSVFFQTSYTLSVAYQGTVVLIESDDSHASPLPVRLRNLYVETFREPLVEAVVAASADDDPIVSGNVIRVLGRRLRGQSTTLTIDGNQLAPPSVSDTEIGATLPAGLRAGLHALQVQHFRRMGTPEVDHRGVESNVAPFVLTPQITGVDPPSNQLSETIAGQIVHSADVTVHVVPDVGREQRVSVLLNERAATDARAYTFPDEPRTADTGTITVRARRVRPAQYLVRIQVDGADSPLTVTAGTYASPTVTL
jgi:hypothetical protein